MRHGDLLWARRCKPENTVASAAIRSAGTRCRANALSHCLYPENSLNLARSHAVRMQYPAVIGSSCAGGLAGRGSSSVRFQEHRICTWCGYSSCVAVAAAVATAGATGFRAQVCEANAALNLEPLESSGRLCLKMVVRSRRFHLNCATHDHGKTMGDWLLAILPNSPRAKPSRPSCHRPENRGCANKNSITPPGVNDSPIPVDSERSGSRSEWTI